MKLIVITGPTASGKTDLAIELAKVINTEIISADSRQVYKGLEIGSAQPSIEHLQEIKHHFIATLSIHQSFSAGDFAVQGNVLLKQLFQKYETVVLVGGSGLYIKALLHGMNEFPEINDEVRNNLNNIYTQEGISTLQRLLKEKDPEYFQKVDTNNPQRILRALEVCISTNKTFSYFLHQTKLIRPSFDYQIFAPNLLRENLYNRIDQRVDLMIAKGLLKEAETLFPYVGLNPLNTIGYKEIFSYFRGEMSLDETILKIKQHTRNFAKRQLTWVQHQFDTVWVNSDDLDSMKNTILNGIR